MLLLLNPAATQIPVAFRIRVPIKLGTTHCPGGGVGVAVGGGVGGGVGVGVGVAVGVGTGVGVGVGVPPKQTFTGVVWPLVILKFPDAVPTVGFETV